jgi:hypothetical protein
VGGFIQSQATGRLMSFLKKIGTEISHKSQKPNWHTGGSGQTDLIKKMPAFHAEQGFIFPDKVKILFAGIAGTGIDTCIVIQIRNIADTLHIIIISAAHGCPVFGFGIFGYKKFLCCVIIIRLDAFHISPPFFGIMLENCILFSSQKECLNSFALNSTGADVFFTVTHHDIYLLLFFF